MAAASDHDSWQAARLLPTVGLRREEEKEQRATSSLLAVMHAVPEFGRALLAGLDAPRGRIVTYTELQLTDKAGRRCIPDGAIVVTRGATRWQCLVEVKTGTANLQREQVSRYLDWARDNSFDAVLTISNEITPSARDLPLTVDKRKFGKVKLFHLSWWRVLTEAIVQNRHRGVSDPDQAWLLGELIAYLDDERSGAGGFHGMGESWVSVRTAAANGTLRASDPGAGNVAERWDQFVDYLSLGLGQDLGREITPVRPRAQTPQARRDAAARALAETGRLDASVRVPDAVGDLLVEADLRTRTVTTSVTLKSPRDWGPKRRVTWLLRQLRDAPADLRVEVSFANARETSSLLLSEARERPDGLLAAADPKREPRAFRVALTQKMGAKVGKEEGSFVRDTQKQAIRFYREIVQGLRAWQPPAPQLPPEPATPETSEPPRPDPPPFSDPETRDPGAGQPPQ